MGVLRGGAHPSLLARVVMLFVVFALLLQLIQVDGCFDPLLCFSRLHSVRVFSVVVHILAFSARVAVLVAAFAALLFSTTRRPLPAHLRVCGGVAVQHCGLLQLGCRARPAFDFRGR